VWRTVAARTNPFFRVRPLAPGVHAAVAVDGGAGLCNAGIVDLGGLTVVFDAMLTPAAGTALRRAAERLTGRRPDVVINSHWHGDHIRGTASFAPVRVVSSRANRALIRRRGPLQLAWDHEHLAKELERLDAADSTVPERDRAMYRGWFRGALATPARLRFQLPDVTFEEALTLEGERRSLSVRTYGGGHSPSDVFAFLEDERTLFLGDLVNTQMHPSVSDGDPLRWIDILRRIRRLRAETAVPGHGEVGGDRDIRAVEQYLTDLVRLARRLRAGARPSEVPMPRRYNGWKFAGFFPENLRRARAVLGRSRRG
jgi:cyclase